jgi:hypothetical protein
MPEERARAGERTPMQELGIAEQAAFLNSIMPRRPEAVPGGATRG